MIILLKLLKGYLTAKRFPQHNIFLQLTFLPFTFLSLQLFSPLLLFLPLFNQLLYFRVVFRLIQLLRKILFMAVNQQFEVPVGNLFLLLVLICVA